MSYLCHTSRTASHSGRVHTFNSQEAIFYQLLVDDRVAYRNKYIRHLSEQWTVRLDRPDAGRVSNPSASAVTTTTKSKPQINTGQPSRNPKSLTAETRSTQREIWQVMTNDQGKMTNRTSLSGLLTSIC